MLQPQELRIGNLILCYDNLHKVSIDTLQQLTPTCGFIKNDHVNGIPVTAQTLKVLKWRKQEYHGYTYYYPNINATWSIRETNSVYVWQWASIVEEDLIWKFDAKILHLHQLQNLYYALMFEEMPLYKLAKAKTLSQLYL